MWVHFLKIVNIRALYDPQLVESVDVELWIRGNPVYGGPSP